MGWSHYMKHKYDKETFCNYCLHQLSVVMRSMKFLHTVFVCTFTCILSICLHIPILILSYLNMQTNMQMNVQKNMQKLHTHVEICTGSYRIWAVLSTKINKHRWHLVLSTSFKITHKWKKDKQHITSSATSSVFDMFSLSCLPSWTGVCNKIIIARFQTARLT